MSSATVTRQTLTTADGERLESEAVVPDALVLGGVVLLHPHPLYGGDMRNAVVAKLFAALPQHGYGCIRFNFRGVGRSSGKHGKGRAERADVRAALEHMAAVIPDKPMWIVGYSFGGDVGLAVSDARLAGWVAIAPPLATFPTRDFAAPTDPRPTYLLVAEHDHFRPPASAMEATSGWLGTTIDIVKAADHFLIGQTAAVTDMVLQRMTRQTR